MPISVSRPLPLRGARNVRELGGYPTASGRRTRSGVFLRGDSLAALTDADNESLYGYGVRRVLDLRSLREVRLAPDAILGYRDVACENIPLSDHIHDADGASPAEAAWEFPASMGEMYRNLLDRDGGSLRRALELCADAPGCLLFHCTAGKDRTGTLAMLLLSLAGVDEETIVADYAATESYMPPYEKLRADFEEHFGFAVPVHVFRSEPASMELALAHLREAYGDAEGYLRHIGLFDDFCERLREKLLEE